MFLLILVNLLSFHYFRICNVLTFSVILRCASMMILMLVLVFLLFMSALNYRLDVPNRSYLRIRGRGSRIDDDFCWQFGSLTFHYYKF